MIDYDEFVDGFACFDPLLYRVERFLPISGHVTVGLELLEQAFERVGEEHVVFNYQNLRYFGHIISDGSCTLDDIDRLGAYSWRLISISIAVIVE